MLAARTLRSSLLVAVALAFLVAPVTAEESSQAEMMQAYMKAAQPGHEHEMLAKGAGTWKCTMKSWMDPAGEPMVSQGTEVAEMVLGGRFLESRFDGESMGMPFQGHGVMGYDNVKKKFVGTWYDSMGTGVMGFEGEYDAAQKKLVCQGDYVDAMSGQTTTATMVTRFVSDDEHVFEMWGPGPAGEDVKWMEIVYERAQ